MNSKIRKYLSNDKWYHGTTLYNAKKIIDNGIIVDYNKGNELDFGYGFYLTPKKEQAESFITKILEFNKNEVEELIIKNLGNTKKIMKIKKFL